MQNNLLNYLKHKMHAVMNYISLENMVFACVLAILGACKYFCVFLVYPILRQIWLNFNDPSRFTHFLVIFSIFLQIGK